MYTLAFLGGSPYKKAIPIGPSSMCDKVRIKFKPWAPNSYLLVSKSFSLYSGVAVWHRKPVCKCMFDWTLLCLLHSGGNRPRFQKGFLIHCLGKAVY